MSDPSPPDPAGKARSPGAAALSQAAAQHLGTVISERYRLVELIAIGGMGAVYKAEHLLLRKWVAVKLLHHQTKNLPEQVIRFEREAIAGAHLQHPNIASATDFGKLPDGSYFLVLEYVRGLPLEDIIKLGPVPAARTVKIVRQIAAAVAAAHERGVIHRDIKPHNVMVDLSQGDLVKLIDFGLAKVPLERFETTDRESGGRGVQRAITQRDMVFGTVAYMAPEAAGGMEKVDERSDLYAIGIILYEMLAGKHPFDATERLELFRQQCTTPPPPLKQRAPEVDVPHELEEVVMWLLRKDPAQRLDSARDLIAILDDVIPPAAPEPAGRGSRPEIDAGAAPPPRPAPRRPPPLVAPPITPPLVPPPVAPPQVAPKEAAPAPRRPGGSSTFAWLEVRKKRRRSWAIGAIVALAAVAIAITAAVLWSARAPDLPPGALDAAGEGSAATPSATASAAAPAGATAAQDRERLLEAAKHKEYSSGEEALIRLLQADPATFRDRDVQKAAAVIAVKIAFRADARADQVFEALGKKLGEGGLDVLYEMVSAHGGTKGAERAMDILKRPDVLGRLSPPLKIAVELREASCKQKPSLFGRAAREGDERAAVVLELLRSPQCNPKIGQCCFREEPALVRALSALRARLRAQP